MSQKPLSLILRGYSDGRLDEIAENMKVINKYIELGVIKFHQLNL